MSTKGKFQPEQWTYAPYAEATVLGEDVPVSSFTLELADNGVPKLVFVIDAFHLRGAPANPAMAPGVGSFVQRWNQLQKAIQSRQNREIDFMFDARGKEDTIQKFSLQGWIMTSAGFSDIRARGGFSLVIEAMHPLYAFQEATPHLMGCGLEAKEELFAFIKDNIYDTFINGMSHYVAFFVPDNLSVDAKRDRHFTGITGLFGNGPVSTLDEYKKQIQRLSQHLIWDPTWDGGKFPGKPSLVKNIFDKHGNHHIGHSVWPYVTQFSHSGSWDWFVHTFLSHWFLHVRPTFWKEHLYIRPIEPWEPHKILIQDTDIDFIELPAVDPSPIRGILSNVDDAPQMSAIEWSIIKDGEAHAGREECSFVDIGLIGRQQTMDMPNWIKTITHLATQELSNYHVPKPENIVNTHYMNDSNCEKAQGGTGSYTRDWVNDRYRGYKGCLQELFLENYRQFYQIALTGRLMIKLQSKNASNADTPDNFVLPGFVLQLRPNPDIEGNGKSPLVDFFVTKVVHTVDCQRASVSTKISGSHVRPATGFSTAIIRDGKQFNIMYKAGIINA